MKTLKESLFDKDLVTKKIATSFLDLFKDHVFNVTVLNVSCDDIFDQDVIKDLKKQYDDVVLPIKRNKRKYINTNGHINFFVNYVLDHVFFFENEWHDEFAKEQEFDPAYLQSSLNKLSKTSVKVTEIYGLISHKPFFSHASIELVYSSHGEKNLAVIYISADGIFPEKEPL